MAIDTSMIVSASWERSEARIRELYALPEDWDGLGADKPKHEFIYAALRLLIRLQSKGEYPPPDRIVPTPDGGVSFEWQTDGRMILADIDETPNEVQWLDWSTSGSFPSRHWKESLT